MSDRPDLARLAADGLAKQRVEPPKHDAAARPATIAAMGRAIEEEPRARRNRRWLAMSVFAAAIMILIVAARGRPGVLAPQPTVATQPPLEASAHLETSGAVALHRAGAPQGTLPLSGASVRAHDRLITANDGHAAVLMVTGTRVTVNAASELLVSSLGVQQDFTVAAGSAYFKVAKLAGGERFVVRTADAELEVRGTAFHVQVDSAATCERTRLRVDEGVVAVRRGDVELLIAAGGTWVAQCAHNATPSASAPAAARASVPAPADKRANKSGKVAAPSGVSDLSQQNDAFAVALAAKKRGDHAAALAAFDSYLARWPGGYHAETATIERVRVSSGAARVIAARAYLTKYPQGAARNEASAIVDGR